MTKRELDLFEKTCPCGIQWDKKGNVKSVIYCAIHRSAPALFKASAELFSSSDAPKALENLEKEFEAAFVAVKAEMPKENKA